MLSNTLNVCIIWRFFFRNLKQFFFSSFLFFVSRKKYAHFKLMTNRWRIFSSIVRKCCEIRFNSTFTGMCSASFSRTHLTCIYVITIICVSVNEIFFCPLVILTGIIIIVPVAHDSHENNDISDNCIAWELDCMQTIESL